ncbi:MAG: DNA-directed DNA polymerase I [Alphaproteobacteria bacterium]|nr:DNA-directed DNA polymerase I [Alphaproteobacteria bacterium]MDA8029910.1 DNA-directed DNA polymerase I [Alphaproteobacteria bacterium]
MADSSDGDWATSIPPSMLVSASYSPEAGAVVLKLYDPKTEKILLWKDETGHRPYCYSRLTPEEIGKLSDVEIERVSMTDQLVDSKVRLTKLIAKEPKKISDQNDGLAARFEVLEADIKYHESYLYDRRLIVGTHYQTVDGKLVDADPEIPESVKKALQTMLLDKVETTGMVDGVQYTKYTKEWADLLNQPIPEIKRLAVDIEVDSVEGKIPDPMSAEQKVTAVGMSGSHDYQRVLVLDDGREKGPKEEGPEPEFFESEKEMLIETFKAMAEHPFILTYNGDDFDLPYLYHRADRLGIPKEEIPLRGLQMTAILKHGISIDLYRVFSNRALQIYAFGRKYTDYTLNSVSEAMLGKKKIDYGVDLSNLTQRQNARYCHHDALLTYELTTFNSSLVVNLLIMACRIGRISIDTVSRTGVSQWIRSLLYYEHRRGGYLIPRRDELEKRSEGVKSDAVIKDKKYRGGLVVDPVKGIHFGVVVMDFASLYPSIIKVRNLSYETVRCPHQDCRKNEIPQTNHWYCTKKNGMTSQLIGSLRDLRVNYYKNLSKSKDVGEDLQKQYGTTSQALKVILNASYGVMGAEIFPLYYLPAAEATTAVGRHTIMESIALCKRENITVLYGDTDSIFIKNPSREQMDLLTKTAKDEHGVDFEVDKTYRYCVMSDRKKNYLGVSDEGKVDIKGLTGKKSHTPKFIKDMFGDVVAVLGSVETQDGFQKAKRQIIETISGKCKMMREGKIPLEDMAFNMMLSKAPSEYTKNIPQHIRAAQMIDGGKGLSKGDKISFIKTKNKSGVKPVGMANLSDVDEAKYMDFLESVLEQILSPLGVQFDEAVGRPKQTGLEQFFYT